MSDAAGRVLELRGERDGLEQRLAAITTEIDGCVLDMLSDGMTGQAVATACGWSPQRVSQLRRRATAAGWGAYAIGAGELRTAALGAFAFARDAQDARAERYSLGYAEERRAFYGDPAVAACEGDPESRVRFAGMYESLEAELGRELDRVS